MTNELSGRITILKQLAEEYFQLDRGALIEQYTRTHRILSIEGDQYVKHPHYGYEVYITRKALKHFVESRKEEMIKRHATPDVLSNILFAVEYIQDVVANFDLYELEPPDRHFYSRDYSSFGKPNLRVLVKTEGGCLNVVSIHFRKHSKK